MSASFNKWIYNRATPKCLAFKFKFLATQRAEILAQLQDDLRGTRRRIHRHTQKNSTPDIKQSFVIPKKTLNIFFKMFSAFKIKYKSYKILEKAFVKVWKYFFICLIKPLNTQDPWEEKVLPIRNILLVLKFFYLSKFFRSSNINCFKPLLSIILKVIVTCWDNKTNVLFNKKANGFVNHIIFYPVLTFCKTRLLSGTNKPMNNAWHLAKWLKTNTRCRNSREMVNRSMATSFRIIITMGKRILSVLATLH